MRNHKTNYAFYRLPNDLIFTKIECKNPRILSSLDSLKVGSDVGYLISPFIITAETPCVFLEAENADSLPIPPDLESKKTVKRYCTLMSEKADELVYHEMFVKAKFFLGKPLCKKIVLARTFSINFDYDQNVLEAMFFRACKAYPRCFISLFSTEMTGTWLIATPELLLANKHGKWQTMALAGTISREEQLQKNANAWKNKNKSEQEYVTHYICEKLSPVSENLVKIGPYPSPAANLFHLRTDITFETSNGKNDLTKILSLLHPTPAVCGIPSRLAQQAILEIENVPRRYYSGFSGPFGIADQHQFFVSLRCMNIKEDNNCLLYAGGGLLPASDETEELEETNRKLRTILNLIEN